MGNLFRLNPLFEFELGAFPQKFDPNSTILLKGNSLEYLFLIPSTSQDIVVLTQKKDISFEEYSKQKWNLSGQFQDSNFRWNPDWNLVEWGKFHTLNPEGELTEDFETIKNSQIINSKISQIQIYKEIDSLNTRILENQPEVKDLLFPLVFKPDFSFSGIEHSVFSKLEELVFFHKKSTRNGVLQEYKNRVLDFSFLYEINDSSMQYLSSTEMQINEKNTYLSSKIKNESSFKSNLQTYSFDFDKVNEKIIELVKGFLYGMKVQYKGPLSVDGFIYKEDSTFHIREISEINFRYTMGRILYEISRKYPENKVHSLVTISSKEYKNKRETRLLDLEEEFRFQFEVQNQFKVKTCILLTPPFLGGKLVSSCVVYYGM